MKRLVKYFSIAMAALVLTFSVGISITSHICLAKRTSSCSDDDSCCRSYSGAGLKATECCKVKSVYLKANFISSGEEQVQKFFIHSPEVASTIVSEHVYDLSVIETRCHAPPLLKSNRLILLSTAKLSV